MSYSIIEKPSYCLYINSTDKISGTNNNATYQVNWNDFLPLKYGSYKMIWSLNSVGGYYKDSNNVTISGATGTSGSASINITTSGLNLTVGMSVVSSASIPANTYIVSVNPTYIGLNNNLTAAIITSTSISFIGQVFSGAILKVNFGTGSLSYDTSSKSASYEIGYIQRDPQSTSSSSNTLSAFYAQNPPKTLQRPNQNFITIQIYNAQTPAIYLYNTDTSGNALSDMTGYNLCMEFVPIESSIVLDKQLY